MKKKPRRAGPVGSGKKAAKSRKPRPAEPKEKRRGSSPASSASPGTGGEAPAPAAPKPKKSPAEKRQDKEAQRAGWAAAAAPPDTPPPPELPRGRGRPSIYPSIDLERVEELARGGLTKREIAWSFGVCYETLRTYQRDFSAFSAAISRGRASGIREYENALRKVGLGYVVPEDKLQYDAEIGKWVRETYLKSYPPDRAALHLLLLKAETGSWRPKMDIKQSGKVTSQVVHIYGPQKKPEGDGA